MMSAQACRWSFVALVLLQLIWFGWLYPPLFWPIPMVLGIMLIPLLVLSPTVWLLRQRALVVAGFLLLFYFSYAVSEAYASPRVRGMALAQIALITVYFVGLFGMWKARRSKGSAKH